MALSCGAKIALTAAALLLLVGVASGTLYYLGYLGSCDSGGGSEAFSAASAETPRVTMSSTAGWQAVPTSTPGRVKLISGRYCLVGGGPTTGGVYVSDMECEDCLTSTNSVWSVTGGNTFSSSGVTVQAGGSTAVRSGCLSTEGQLFASTPGRLYPSQSFRSPTHVPFTVLSH